MTSPDTISAIRQMYDRLFRAYGPQHWWPAETKTEIVIGAILTQNTSWTNVERAIRNLRCAGALDWKPLHDLPADRLRDLLRPAGTFRVKAARLRAFVDRLWSDYGGSLDRMLSGEVDTLRRRLLDIHGIGRETADAILLYAGGRAVFVVDTYTKRVLRRHHLIDPNDNPTYDGVQQLFHTALPRDAQLFNEYHALLVAVGKNHCRSRATCGGCPLDEIPHGASV